MRYIVVILVISTLFLGFADPSSADLKEPGMVAVFLYNPAAGDLKTRCLEVFGRYDYRSHFECYDTSGSLKRFDLGNEWQPVPLTPACCRHVTRDTVKMCAAYQLGAKQAPKYVCLDDESGKYAPFDLGGEWKALPKNDPVCAEREFGPDVIKDFEFEIKVDASGEQGGCTKK